MNFTILRFDTIDSTNTEALKQARAGADEGLCIVARQQTAGRGRHGRTWISAKDAGLYCSIVLRLKIETRYLPLITLMIGVSVCDTLAELGLRPDIKWVNDILIGEKKIAGILAETAETNRGLAVVVGIGINLKPSNFPPEIVNAVTSIETETGRYTASDELLASLTSFLDYFYKILQDDAGPETIRREWQRRSTYFSGKSVRVRLENETITGTTDGLEDNGALRIKTAGGIRIVQAGDVETLRNY
jgi:BirA family biotin operon repressor/biotin-[acetyl-CoA-carboxylase] ligase